MNKKILQSAAIILGGVVSVVFAATFYSSPSKAASTNSAVVTIADLQKTGFTQVKQLVPLVNGRFSGPNLYFEVSDKVTAPSSEAPNIVMTEDFVAPYTLTNGAIFNYGPDSHDFIISGGNGKEATMFDGRVAINFIKNNHYDVVIGPNKSKVELLASIMASKIQ